MYLLIDLRYIYIQIDNKIQTYENGEHFCVYGIIDEPIDKVFKIISKEENYPNFMPRFTAVDYHYTNGNYSYYTFHIGLPLSIEYQYKIKITEFQSDEFAWIAWELVDWKENSIADTWGQWYFTPVDNNKNLHITLANKSAQVKIVDDRGYLENEFVTTTPIRFDGEKKELTIINIEEL